MNEFQVSADLGRIPGKIYRGEGFSNFTADQWRIFISIYATVVLWEYLEEVDRKILTYFVRICHLFVNRILETKSLDEIHKKIVDVVMLIEKKYGRNVITPNLHLSLHLSACSHDFGPLYAFWCFSFERMNGILGSLPNSHRQIEPELIRRLINDNRINKIIYIENNTKSLEILNICQSVGSFSEMDQFGLDEIRRFWMYSRTIQESTISGKEPFPGEMLKPFSENIPLSADGILDLMIAYYNDTYENLKFRKPFETDSLNSIIIPLKINKYCCCRIGSEIFGSIFSPRHQKSLYILAKFASEDDSIDIYPGQIQFFFVHEISTNRINMENHYLAYVRWYKKIKNRFYFSVNKEQICNIELWDTEFYPKSRDCIIPVHHILGRFVPVKYKISDRKNAKEYLAVNPINRKYNLR
ncbi:hypothetical protein Glove_21g152 [Diversispora epigaea]|uniref:Transposase domain-containing protein n=1 Tax=Diversispora epigaea TaxID=1348612 RepID=A0A397JRN5_9GLOM|nr:hypothetical protein Glove_21g152 [Diversispora epigaea]